MEKDQPDLKAVKYLDPCYILYVDLQLIVVVLYYKDGVSTGALNIDS